MTALTTPFTHAPISLGIAMMLLVVLSPSPSLAGPERPQIDGELPATTNDLQRPRANNSPMLAVDPTNPRFVVLANRVDAPAFSCALHVSGNGGRTFVPAIPVPKLPRGADRCYAPEVAFDGEGVLYYLFAGLRGSGNTPMGAFLTTSTDQGRSFGRPRRVLGPNNFSVRMAIDRSTSGKGRIHLVWLAASADPSVGSLPPPPNPIRSAYSDDGGRTFSKPVDVSDPRRDFVVAPSLAVGPDHAIHVAYYDLGRDRRDYQGLEGPTWEEPWSLLVSTSRDGGEHFQKSLLVDDDISPPGRVMLIFTMPPPSIAADGEGGVFLAWHDARNGDWDVFLRRSHDGGRRWESVHRLNNDPVNNGRHQYLPRLSVAPGGRLDAIFYDRRRDPRNLRNDVSYTFSMNGGRTFAVNERLTSRSSDSSFGQSYLTAASRGLVDIGSRLALASNDDGFTAAWADTRNSVRDVQQDVFVAKARFRETAGSTSDRLVVPAVVAVGAAGMFGVWLNRLVARRRNSTKIRES